MNNPIRQRARIVPPSPITVAIDDENGLPIGYGIIANVSDAGGCIWTDSHLDPGSRLSLRVSFSRPAEVHEAAALVVWGDEGEDRAGCRMDRYGLRWEGRLVRLRATPARARARGLGRKAHSRPGHGPRPASPC